MRITIHIDDNLHAELKNIAARTGRTLTAVNHGARNHVRTQDPAHRRERRSVH